MHDPYLLFGVRLTTAAPGPSTVVDTVMKDIEDLLAVHGSQVTELKASGVYVAQVKEKDAEELWVMVSDMLTQADAQAGDDLQWFAHLADRNGCELSYN